MNHVIDDLRSETNDAPKHQFADGEPVISLGPNLYQPPMIQNPECPLSPGELNAQQPFQNDLVPIYALRSNQPSQNGPDSTPNFNHPFSQQSPAPFNSAFSSVPQQIQQSNSMAISNIDVLRRQSTSVQSARRPKPLLYGKHSVEIECPHCSELMRTKVIKKFDVTMICLLITFSFFMICFLIGLCTDAIKVHEHRCPQCDAFIGTSQVINFDRNPNNRR